MCYSVCVCVSLCFAFDLHVFVHWLIVSTQPSLVWWNM